MKRFEVEQIKQAQDYAMRGGQALHVHSLNFGHFLFRRYPEIAHLFDQDEVRLVCTARRLGVRVIKVERKNERGQHIDLCGRPFDRACKLALLEERNPS